MKLRLMNKDQTDRYMSKQLTRIGDKVLEDTGHVENVNREWLISKFLWKENQNEYFK